MFIKRGDAKIISVIEDEELTEDQKKSVNKISEKKVDKKVSDKQKLNGEINVN